MIALSPGVDRIIRRAHGIFSRGGQRCFTVLLAISKQAKDFVYRKGAGDLSGGRAAHAVANNIDTGFDRESEGIFIGWALTPAVSNRRSRVADDSRGQEKPPQASLHVSANV
jgi:hypothetical protein